MNIFAWKTEQVSLWLRINQHFCNLFIVFAWRTNHKLTSNAHTYNKIQYINIKNNNTI